MMDICLLGSGATMPTPERGLSAAVLRCNGRGILFDCGEGTQLALRREKISPMKIDLIALSHYHGDHIFGLPGLLQTMSCLERKEPLFISGPEGIEAAIEPIMRLAGVQCFDIYLIKSLPDGGLHLNELHRAWGDKAALSAVKTEHRCASQGYVFTLSRAGKFDPVRAKELGIPIELWRHITASPEKPIICNGRELSEGGRVLCGHDLMSNARRGLKLVFSGDTRPCEGIKNAARDADLLIHDATYGEDEYMEQALIYGHSTFREAAELALAAGAKRLWLTHFSQIMRRPSENIANAAAHFPGAVCGSDGLKANISFNDT